MDTLESDSKFMARAVELARFGEGFVEPNPMVGCVIVRENEIVGEGYHRVFGGPHAEMEALKAAGAKAKEATCYVTLEPCCHKGKTPPCVPALIAAGIQRVVIAVRDPNPLVNGAGIDELRRAKISVETGVLDHEVMKLNAPFFTCIEKKRPWIHAKWAMTLDGKIASRTGSSQWISGDQSLAVVHRLRGMMDAIMIGARTAMYDDPLLTVRKDVIAQGERPNLDLPLSLSSHFPHREKIDFTVPRTPLRIVMDSTASILPQSRLVQTASEAQVLVAVGPDAREVNIRRLQDAGCEVIKLPGRIQDELNEERRAVREEVRNRTVKEPEAIPAIERRRFVGRTQMSTSEVYRHRMSFLLEFLARKGITNLLVEGGGTLLGSFFDARWIDEVHAFVAPKIIGGEDASHPIGGTGMADMVGAYRLYDMAVSSCGPDVYIRGRVRYPS